MVPAMAAPNDASNATAETNVLPRRLPSSPFRRNPMNGMRGMSQSLSNMYGDFSSPARGDHPRASIVLSSDPGNPRRKPDRAPTDAARAPELFGTVHLEGSVTARCVLYGTRVRSAVC